MTSQHIVAGYSDTDEAADGLALAGLLAERLGDDLVVARVLTGTHDVVSDRRRETDIRRAVAETRGAIVAAIPDASYVEIVPIVDPSMARGLHDLAHSEHARAIVLGATHHHALGRLLLGSGPELVANGAPCPVVVAPPGFREHADLKPRVIGAAYDGTPASEQALRFAAELAAALGAELSVYSVRAPWPLRPIGAPRDVAGLLTDAINMVHDWTAGSVVTQAIERQGDPAHELVAATDGEVGLLVVGSRHLSRLGRALLGSVSGAVLRGAHAPVVVTPRA